jgi:PiT family inorganic phosphate transporter
MMAAVLNFVGALSGTAVAKAIGKGIVEPQLITNDVLVAAMAGAIFWNILTWFLGFPAAPPTP